MRTVEETFTAGEVRRYNIGGNFFRLIATALPVDVDFIKGERVLTEKGASSVEAGYWSEPDGGFDAIQITSSGNQTVKMGFTHGRGGYDRSVGSVDITNVNGSFAHSNPTVTNVAGGVTVAAANAARRYLAIQNNHISDTLRVTVDGTAPTATHGFKVAPGGGSLEFQGFVPTGAVKALATVAGNTDVEVVTA